MSASLNRYQKAAIWRLVGALPVALTATMEGLSRHILIAGTGRGLEFGSCRLYSSLFTWNLLLNLLPGGSRRLCSSLFTWNPPWGPNPPWEPPLALAPMADHPAESTREFLRTVLDLP